MTAAVPDLRADRRWPGAFVADLASPPSVGARDLDARLAGLPDDGRGLSGDAPAAPVRDAVRGRPPGCGPSFASIVHGPTSIRGTEDGHPLDADGDDAHRDGGLATLRAVAFPDRDAEGRVRSVRIQGAGPVVAAAREPEAGAWSGTGTDHASGGRRPRLAVERPRAGGALLRGSRGAAGRLPPEGRPAGLASAGRAIAGSGRAADRTARHRAARMAASAAPRPLSKAPATVTARSPPPASPAKNSRSATGSA